MKRILLPLLLALGTLLAACSSDTAERYELGAQAYLDVAEGAEVTFTELADGGTEVTIDFGGELDSDFETHPAHIHVGDAGTSGDIVVSLNPVDGATGTSTTTVTNFDEDGPENGAEVTYEDLITYDGYVNVHLSGENLDVIVASANIGANADVALPAVPTIAEQATASESFTTLVAALEAAELTATFADAAAGPFTVLAPTDDAFASLLRQLDVTQEELLARDDLADILRYHVLPNVLVRTEVVAAASAEDGTDNIQTLLEDATLSLSTDANGNNVVNSDSSNDAQVIVNSTNVAASNGVIHAIDGVLLPPEEPEEEEPEEETPENTVYTLSEVDGSGVSGSAIFTRTSDTETEVTLNVMGDAVTGNHPAHIHMGTSGSGGPIVITLEPVNAEGESVSTVTAFDGEDGARNAGDAVTYEALLEYDGYINVHESPDNLENIIATGNIGANVE